MLEESERPFWLYIITLVVGLAILLSRFKTVKCSQGLYAFYAILLLVTSIYQDSERVTTSDEAHNFYTGSVYGAGFVLAIIKI